MFKTNKQSTTTTTTALNKCFIKCKNNVELWVERNRYCIESIIIIIIKVHSLCFMYELTFFYVSLEILDNIPLTRAI